VNLVIVDIGCGNIGSVAIAFERFGIAAAVSGVAEEIAAADKVVLPGVGAAGHAMRQIDARGLAPVLRGLRQPALGICLGMQLLYEGSDEAEGACLGLLAGRVRRLEPAPGRPVPHMGWSRLEVRAPDIGLVSGDYVYFAHGFACDAGPGAIATAEYGLEVPAAVRSGNWLGAQFHPERSGEAGARFLRAWLDR